MAGKAKPKDPPEDPRVVVLAWERRRSAGFVRATQRKGLPTTYGKGEPGAFANALAKIGPPSP